jgi:hypothetical protein
MRYMDGWNSVGSYCARYIFPHCFSYYDKLPYRVSIFSSRLLVSNFDLLQYQHNFPACRISATPHLLFVINCSMVTMRNKLMYYVISVQNGDTRILGGAKSVLTLASWQLFWLNQQVCTNHLLTKYELSNRQPFSILQHTLD